MNLGPAQAAKLPVKGFLAGVPMTFEARAMTPPSPTPAVHATAEEAVREATLSGLQPFLVVLGPRRVRLVAVGERGAEIIERQIQGVLVDA